MNMESKTMDYKGKPLRILHISALPLWAMAGNAGMCCLRETLLGHVRAGYTVTIILPGYNLFDDDQNPLSIPTSNDFEIAIAPCRWLSGIKALRAACRRLGDGNEIPYPLRWILGQVTWTFITASLVWKAMGLRYRKFDVVYAHNEYAAIAGFFIRVIFGIPNVTRLYGTFVSYLMKRPLVWLRYPIAAGGFLVPHSLLICANDGTRGDEVARKLHLNLKRFRFWQDGVDRHPPPLNKGRGILCRTHSHLRENSLWVLSCSRLSYWKRIDRILCALKIARIADCDCQLIAAGDGKEKERLVQMASQMGLDRDVIWIGSVPHEDIWHLMNMVDMFIIANDITNRCNPLFEAIRAELPVVSLRDPSTQDLLTDGENACLADSDDGEKLGEALTLVCSDESLRQRMRLAQRNRDELLWTWKERMVVEVREIEELAGRRVATE